MNKAEIKTAVKDLLSSGAKKSDVFSRLSGQGLKDSLLAYIIAAHPNSLRCEQHRGKVNILITLVFIQAVIAFLIGYGLGLKIGPNAKWVIAIISSAIPLLFIYGFYTNHVGAYNAWILLSLIQITRSILDSFSGSKTSTLISLTISICLTAYVWYVRNNISPGFNLSQPKKINNQYIFID